MLATAVVEKYVEYPQPSVRRYWRLIEDIWQLKRPLTKEATAQSVFGLPALKNVILEFKLIKVIMHLWEID
jgi:hypothetical protein